MQTHIPSNNNNHGLRHSIIAQVIQEVAAVLGIELKHATMKHAQTIGLLKRTHASQKMHLKAATYEFRNNWYKYLPLAVLNHNTTYHASFGCEPSRVLHGRIPNNILDYKLGYNPNLRYQPHVDVAEEIQKRMKILLDRTKKNIMQSSLKYKAYYDRKAKTSQLETMDYCYILAPKADTQATKIPFREFRWFGTSTSDLSLILITSKSERKEHVASIQYYNIQNAPLCEIMDSGYRIIRHYAELRVPSIRHHAEIPVPSMRHHAESQDVEYAVLCGIVYISGQ